MHNYYWILIVPVFTVQLPYWLSFGANVQYLSIAWSPTNSGDKTAPLALTFYSQSDEIVETCVRTNRRAHHSSNFHLSILFVWFCFGPNCFSDYFYAVHWFQLVHLGPHTSNALTNALLRTIWRVLYDSLVIIHAHQIEEGKCVRKLVNPLTQTPDYCFALRSN